MLQRASRCSDTYILEILCLTFESQGVETVKKALCFPLRTNLQEVFQSHFDDNCISNGCPVLVSKMYIVEILCRTIESKL